MSPFYEFGSWVMGGLKRMLGIQYNFPSYAEESASPVTFDSAMQLSAVWACVKLLAETPASLPLQFYRRLPDGSRELDPEHDLAELFAGKVNRYQNRVEFWESVLLNLLVHGNAYCQIERRNSRVVSLLPLMSAQMETRLLSDGSLSYQYENDQYGVTVFAEKSIWHLKLMGNGITGLSPLAYQRNTLGIAQAAEKAVSNVYRNGAKPSGVLKLDRMLTKAQRDEVREAFATLTTGNNNRLMVLEKGTDFQAISLSPQDIELLSSRKFQISEICRWYGVPSVLVNDNNGTTTWGSGIEQIMQGFYKLTLRPLLEKIEASMAVNLLTPQERRTVEVEFDFNALLRSDLKTMFEAYKSAVNGSLMTPNEARRELNLQPVDAGDTLFLQGAMAPIERLAEPPAPAPPAAPDPLPQITELAQEVRRLRDVQMLTKAAGAPAAQPVNVNVGIDTAQVEELTRGVQKMHRETLDQIRKDVQDMPVIIPAPIVNVEAIMPELKQVNPVVNITNQVQPAGVTVVDNHPVRAVQTVERDGNDEIKRTVITYEKG